MEYFESAVVFYDFCVKALDKDSILDKPGIGIYKKNHLSSITSDNARMLLENAIKAHDDTLRNLGQFGLIHRCSSQPFRKDNKKVEIQVSEGTDVHLNFNDSSSSYLYANVLFRTKPEFGVSDVKMSDKLCLGGKIKVILYSVYISLYSSIRDS